MIIDTHAHVNFNAYKGDSEEVLRRSLDNNVWLINVGSQYSTSQRAVNMAERYKEGVYAAVGLHPAHLETGLVQIKDEQEEIQFEAVGEEFDYEKYKTLAKSPKVVAIGEVGLDYYRKPNKAKQREILLKQMDLANELKLPLIFHCRMAHDDLIEIISNFPLPAGRQEFSISKPGVIHCFTGNWEQAQKYIEMGFYLAFDGIIFRMNLDETIKKVPVEKILLETDCPYLMPPQVEGRNEPIYIKYIAEKIAKIKNLSCEEIAAITTRNAKELFKIQ